MNRKSKSQLVMAICVAVCIAITGISSMILLFKAQMKREGDNMEYDTVYSSDGDIGNCDRTPSIHDPSSEVRGVWIATVNNIDYPSQKGLSEEQLKAELEDIVKTVKECSLTSIFFQVRPACDSLYKSSIFPSSYYVTGDYTAESTFDSLEYLIQIAHMEGIEVHAWINPLRVTYYSCSLDELNENSPARLNPDWVVEYDGKLYFDCGLPSVRQLICDGIEEICVNYDVDGIAFDDYFYPYPVSGCTFDDSQSYLDYGNGADKEDWRRENVNSLIKSCYDTVKSVDKNIDFGISPFGIWQNDDGENGGSDTAGFEGYSSLYADALAWINGGYIDYIAPQLYWSFTQSNARFDILCRWWNAQCSGTGVKLLISHAANYSENWESDTEIKNQVEFARAEQNYAGSIMFGYSSIKSNVQNLQGQLCDVFAEEIIVKNIESDGSEVLVSTPENGSRVTTETIYIIGKCDPAYPLYMDGSKISVTKAGYFSAYVSLKSGVNSFTFEQNGVQSDYSVTLSSSYTPSEVTYTDLGEFIITNTKPQYAYNGIGGGAITLSCYAPGDSIVTATLNGITVALNQQTWPLDDGDYLAAYYEGTYKLPSAASGETIDLGTIIYNAEREDEYATADGVSIKVSGQGNICAVEVIKNDSELKIDTDSWYYDDYTPCALGMRDYAVSLSSGYYKLSMGGYVAAENVRVINDNIDSDSEITSLKLTNDSADNRTKLIITVPEKIPVDGHFNTDGQFVITLFNVSTSLTEVEYADNMLFESLSLENGSQSNSLRIVCNLFDTENYYGFEYYYTDEGETVVSFRNPTSLADGDKPLEGKTIIVDAGHGGEEKGADTPIYGYEEKYLNLKIALVLQEKLEALGANVIMTRTDDSTVKAEARATLLNDTNPDLCVSVHQNSMQQGVDATIIRGLLGLYFSESGTMLTRCVANSTADALNVYRRVPYQQRLIMVRNPKFPSTLIEVGFLTYVEEFNIINCDEGIEKSAQGIADGIIDFYEKQSEYIK